MLYSPQQLSSETLVKKSSFLKLEGVVFQTTLFCEHQALVVNGRRAENRRESR